MKKIFAGNDDFKKSAFLNWRTSKHEEIANLMVLADGFLNSAIELAKTSLSNNQDKKADILIFPMLANANHGIELYLKCMIWTLNKLIGSGYKIEGRHNIKQMIKTVESKIKKYQNEESKKWFIAYTEDLHEYINELFVLIKGIPENDKMDFSRYPITDKYENHFYIDEIGNVEVDLENFIVRFEKIRDTLDDRASYYFYQELKQEW